jgi:hypothetical protein
VFDFIRGRFSHQFNSFRQRWCQQRTLPFTDVLSAERVEVLLVEEGVEFRESVFTPLVTLWTFLGQVFHPDHSCREAVARLIAFLVGQGQRPCAGGTGAYCEARQRLPERLLERLVRSSGDQLHARVPAIRCTSSMAPRFRCPTRQPISRLIRKLAPRSPALAFRSPGW